MTHFFHSAENCQRGACGLILHRMSGILNGENWINALPEAVRDEMRTRFRRIQVAAGDVLYTASDDAKGIFHVAAGHLRLTGLQEDGRQVLITIYAPGACFAETAVVGRRTLNHTVTALTPAAVELLPAADFWELYGRFPAIAEALCRKFADTIGRQLAARESRVTLRLGQRIAAVFVDLADRCGATDSAKGAAIDLPMTQNDLAEFFDVTRQSIQREMTMLKHAAGLAKIGGVWRIDDMVALRAY